MNAEGRRTPGETIFEDYLARQNLPFEFEKEHPGKSKRPDTITWDAKTIVFDVKDFDAPPNVRMGAGTFDPYPRIREKIEQGRDKFKSFKEFCCGLVLFNVGHPEVRLHEEHIMLGSMYGDSGFTFPVNTETGVGDISKMERAFLGRGKMLRPNRNAPQNTTISAVITLSQIRPHYLSLLDMVHERRRTSPAEIFNEAERTIPNFDPDRAIPRVIVWHNAVARIPFPEGPFCGPYDTHFGVVEEQGGVFPRVTYRGALIPARLNV